MVLVESAKDNVCATVAVTATWLFVMTGTVIDPVSVLAPIVIV